jgi:hypothetical protein
MNLFLFGFLAILGLIGHVNFPDKPVVMPFACGSDAALLPVFGHEWFVAYSDKNSQCFQSQTHHRLSIEMSTGNDSH